VVSLERASEAEVALVVEAEEEVGNFIY
jgi:hypothetical protein